MDKRKNELLTNNEVLFLLVGCIIGAGILSLPNSIVSKGKQDGWISTIIGSIYPIYVILVGSIIIKKYPNQNIMSVSKLCLGNFLGSLLNFMFMAQFILYVIGVIGAANSVLRVYAVWFMSSFNITLVLALLIIYASFTGLKTIAKLNILMFIVISMYMLTALPAFSQGTLLNVQPFLGAGMDNIFSASVESAFAYGNMELLLVIYPYAKYKKKIVKTALTATGIITFTYALTVFLTTFYLGPDIVPKSLWPFFFVSESVRIPVITSFRFVAMALWSLVIFKTAATQYYAATAILNNIISSIDRKFMGLFLSPFILIFPLFFENEVVRRDFLGKVMPWVTLFNIGYVTFIAVLALFKKSKGAGTSPSNK